MREQFRVDRPLRAVVRLGAGCVDVVPAGGDPAWVCVEARDPGHEASVRLAARASIRQVDDQLRVEVPAAGRAFRRAEVRVVLGLPERSSLAIRGGAADVTAHGSLDTIAVKVGTGRIDVDEVLRSADVQAGQAEVRVGAAGTLAVAFGRGTVAADRVGGGTVRLGQGSVHLGRTQGAVAVKGGRVTLTVAEAGPGDLTLDTGSGGAAIGVASGTTVHVDLRSGFGDVRCDLPLEPATAAGGAALRLRLRTGSGNLRVTTAVSAGR